METGKKHPSGEPLTVLRKVRGKVRCISFVSFEPRREIDAIMLVRFQNPLTGNDQESKGWFGMNFIHRRFPGRVAVGDTVEIVERHPPTPVWRESSS